MMSPDTRIYVAGHRGLVGSAITRALEARGHQNLLLRTSAELDLRDAQATDRFFSETKPQIVIIAAAKVGGIHANATYPVEFLNDNLAIQSSIINAAYRHGVDRLLFLGSSCIYPRDAPQPLKEEYLLTGPLEETNRPYALAKIAGIELCWSYNRQYGTRYLAAMPTNLYGPNDNYHAENSHVIPGLIRRFHEAKVAGAPAVKVWGSGKPLREFMHSDDMAAACLSLLDMSDERFDSLLRKEETGFAPPLINIGTGEEVSISQLANSIALVVGYKGCIDFDPSLPDGTPRKLMDISRLSATGFVHKSGLEYGLQDAYNAFLCQPKCD